RYMDRLAVALHPAHASHASRYEAALRERNRLLSENRADPAWFSSIEAQLASNGAALAASRASLVDRLERELATLPDVPFARPALRYHAGGPADAEAFAQDLA